MSRCDPLTVSVELGERSYDIKIGPGLLKQAGGLIAPALVRPRVAIITDENVARSHLKVLSGSLENSGIRTTSITVPAGETTKSYNQLAFVCDELLKSGIERKDMIIALGGGVIGDLAGFAAAILRRGVDFIQIPTSLLAQVDSAVGGKTGINSPLGKNLIGAFHQPRLVLADTDVLNTLPDRELRAGYAEMVKYGLLGDAEFFEWLEKNGNDLLAGNAALRQTAIRKSCESKATIVAADERESGKRALLNLGHTFGHALEAAAGYSNRLLHGEGVAIGMSQAFRFSHQLGFCRKEECDRVQEHLADTRLPYSVGDLINDLPRAERLLEIMHQDKKAETGQLTFILVHKIGDAFISRDVAESDILAFLQNELGQS